MATKYFIDSHNNFYKFIIDVNKVDLKVKKISQHTFYNESKYTSDDINKIITSGIKTSQRSDYIMWDDKQIDYKLYNLIVYLNQNNFITIACDQGDYGSGYIRFQNNLIDDEKAFDRLKKLLNGIPFKLNDEYKLAPPSEGLISSYDHKKFEHHDYYNSNMIFIDHLFRTDDEYFVIRFHPKMIQLMYDKIGIEYTNCDLKILGNIIIDDLHLHMLNISNIIDLQIDTEFTKTLNDLSFVYTIMGYHWDCVLNVISL